MLNETFKKHLTEAIRVLFMKSYSFVQKFTYQPIMKVCSLMFQALLNTCGTDPTWLNVLIQSSPRVTMQILNLHHNNKNFDPIFKFRLPIRFLLLCCYAILSLKILYIFGLNYTIWIN